MSFKDFLKILKDGKLKDRKIADARDERCIPMAYFILKMIADKQPPMAIEQKDVERLKKEFYEPLSRDIIGEMLEAGFRYNEINYTFRLLREPIEHLATIMEETANMHYETAETILFGKPYNEITINDIDRIVKKELDAHEFERSKLNK